MSGSRFPPLLKSSLEMMEHAIEHLHKGTTRDMGFAILHADNSIELILKELMRSKGIRLMNKKGYSLNYYECIDQLSKIGVAIPELPSIDLLHTERNNTYHLGNKPDTDRANWLVYDVALSFLRRVCMDEMKVDINSFSEAFKLSEETKHNVELTRSDVVNKYLIKAHDAYKMGLFDSTIMSSYIGIEALMREYIFSKMSIAPRHTYDMVKAMKEKEILSPKSLRNFEKLRYARNRVAHGVEEARKEEARFALKIFKEVINEVGLPLELKCKTCSVLFSSGIVMNRKTFERTTLEGNIHECPNGHVNSYNKADYILKL